MIRRIAMIALLLAVAGGAGALVTTTLEVHRHARVDEARPAEVVVVYGAANYAGRPSPVLKARLDHALELYRRKLAPRILTTGGSGGDPHFTEGETGRDYLIRNGVPPEAVIVETEARSTAESTAAIGEILRRMGLNEVIVVTDGYHVYRAKRMLEAQGLRVWASPRAGPVRDDARFWLQCLRQAAALRLWWAGVVI
ncbi:MAG: YdcF family protein [Bryobacteraceae bacterium]